MWIASFNGNRLGVVEGDTIADVTTALDAIPPQTWPLSFGDPLYRYLDAVVARASELLPDAPRSPISDIVLNSPVRTPSKIIAAPVNYKKHLDEARDDVEINRGAHVRTIDELGVFLKSSTSVIGAGETIRLPFDGRRIDHEIELAAIIGREGKSISRDDALEHVAGYAIGLDMSVRGTEDRSWRKSHDTFTVIGPWLVTADELPDVSNLDFSLSVNGSERQNSNTSMMIWDVAKLIEYASATYTIYPGDIIMTGTPEGVSPVGPGDVLECRIEKIGEMTVNVR